MPRKTQKVNPGVRRYGLKSNYTSETLEEALSKIRSGAMSRLAASKFYKIPAVTLFYKLKSKHIKPVGKPVTFSKDEETSFKAHLLLLSDLGIPMSMMDFRFVVKNYLDSNNMTKPQFKNNLPGYEWGVLFLERNPELKTKIAYNISRKRAQVTREMVEEFFEHIKTEIEGVPPENIYNMDESGFHDDPGKKKLLFRRDSRHPEVIKNTSKSCYTVVFCANAGGEVLPPFFIFKGKRLWSDWLFQAPSGSRMAVSESGWIDSSIFEEWLEKHFIPHVDKQNGKKVLLCDNLSAHISPKALRLCSEHNITFICLLPNSTHLLQPLDVGYFSGLKTSWRKVLNDYRQTNKGKKVQALPKSLFAQLLKKSLNNIEGTSSDNVKAGFQSCGLQPFSPSTVLNKLPRYTSQADVCDSIGTSFINYIEEIRQGDSHVKKGRKFQLPVTAGKSVSAEEVEKYYEERDNTNKSIGLKGAESDAQTKKKGRPPGF
ncbi:unnamed protein product [Parnassius mnemosyne]|uniref:DDE-1 domain-containing protein n=1 Tax=Parnassius mnemosyne TaxID=213953 RepID=A0AAV1LX11_9NEOP